MHSPVTRFWGLAAAKVSRTWTTLLKASNRYRRKGQQKVTVEHVHVHCAILLFLHDHT